MVMRSSIKYAISMLGPFKGTIQQDKLHGRPNYTLCDTFSLFILKKAGIMADKTCKTCIENDNGLCDRKGILIEEDDSCENHTKNWMDSLMEKFIRKSMR